MSLDPSAKAEISSMSYTISELAKRASSLGDKMRSMRDEASASELYQAEKALLVALRRLENATR
ncbi:hypothetical protein SAMN02745225_01516 [Ferrithrix thermotolerans DSM 19514]|jgi:hypothetical protein|uniref:Uncharacterized protein n=1 Tax=Ferrithrix thermotolerans DSM 19514 TaxID=1121881 RepID=A0A1M4W2A0_9ACTN|nr:hypothetical protein [Ferrithrix thermotolerans]SHE75280.1 hypothetical protein SAMN02745225_01516 [Ferrithrix thermotolerans DSM 19514]